LNVEDFLADTFFPWKNASILNNVEDFLADTFFPWKNASILNVEDFLADTFFQTEMYAHKKHLGAAGIALAGGSARSAKEQFAYDREAVFFTVVKKALGRLAPARAMPATP
jgi:hypothetical protein